MSQKVAGLWRPPTSMGDSWRDKVREPLFWAYSIHTSCESFSFCEFEHVIVPLLTGKAKREDTPSPSLYRMNGIGSPNSSIMYSNGSESSCQCAMIAYCLAFSALALPLLIDRLLYNTIAPVYCRVWPYTAVSFGLLRKLMYYNVTTMAICVLRIIVSRTLL